MMYSVRRLVGTLVAFYERRPATVTMALAGACLLIMWWPVLFGVMIAPYDYQTADYPSYVDSVRAARFSIFCVFNPFSDGGVPTPNLLSQFDPIEWLPLLGTGVPGYGALQAAFLAHLLLIPAGLLLVARANDVPRNRWIFIVGISAIAYACGPTLKYFQQTNAIPACSLYVLLFGLLEAYRRFGGFHYVALAALAFAYADAHWVYGTVFFPLVLAAYVLANARGLFSTRRRIAESVGAVALAAIVAFPGVLFYLKFDRVVEISRHLGAMTDEVDLSQIPGLLGAPLSELTLVTLPAGLIALIVVGLRNSSRLERWLFGAAIAALVLYGFSDRTAFGPIFRQVYPLAGVIRRPYATWYVLVPFVLFLSARGLIAPSVLLTRAVMLVAAGATGYACLHGAPWPASIVVLGSIAAIAIWPWQRVIVCGAVLQWLVIAWIPFWQSPWRPGPIAAAGSYLAPYASVRAYLPFVATDSSKAYRIANVGLPAQFGAYSGAWEIYGSAASYNTSAPHELVVLLGTADLHAAALPGVFVDHPAEFADANWERLGVRYYVVGPGGLAAVQAGLRRRHNVHLLDVPGYWGIIEDTSAAPFVSAELDDKTSVPVRAAMTRDTYEFDVPKHAARILFANVYDSWWTVNDDRAVVGPTTVDDRGQLVLDARLRRGHHVVLHYTNRPFVAALAVSLVVQCGLAVYLLALGLLRRAARRNERHVQTNQ